MAPLHFVLLRVSLMASLLQPASLLEGGLNKAMASYVNW